MIFIFLSRLFAFIFFGLGLIVRFDLSGLLRHRKSPRGVQRALTDEFHSGISVLLVSRGLRTPEQGRMVSKEYFVQTGIADGVQENFLTYDEVFTLLRPYATIPYEGAYEGGWSVKVLQEQFCGTPFAPFLQAVREGESLSASAFHAQLLELGQDVEQSSESRVLVSEDGLSYWHKREQITSGKYYLDWISRNSRYRLAVQQMMPDIADDELDDIVVVFTTFITQSNQFMLFQGRNDRIPDMLGSDHELTFDVQQLQLFESDASGMWSTHNAFLFVGVEEIVPGVSSSKEIRALLNQPSLPAAFFSWDQVTFPTHEHDRMRTIYAPIPTDLQLPPSVDT